MTRSRNRPPHEILHPRPPAGDGDVALALGWFLGHQNHAKLTEKVTKLAEENEKLQIQADLDAIDRAVPSREFEQYKLKTPVESLQSQAPALGPPKK